MEFFVPGSMSTVVVQTREGSCYSFVVYPDGKGVKIIDSFTLPGKLTATFVPTYSTYGTPPNKKLLLTDLA